MSVRWVTLWVRPPHVKICVSVRWVTLWVLPPLVKICVFVRWVTLWVRQPPALCVSRQYLARAYTTLVVLVTFNKVITDLSDFSL